MVEHLLELEHEIVFDCFLAHLSLLAFFRHISVQNQVSELVDHEELLKNRVHVTSGSHVPETHVLRPHLTLLSREDGAKHIPHISNQALIVNRDEDIIENGPALLRKSPI